MNKISEKLGLKDDINKEKTKEVDVYRPYDVVKPNFSEQTNFNIDKKNSLENVKKMITLCEKNIDEMTQIATSTGEPKAFETLTKMIQTYNNLNETLLRMYNAQLKIDENNNKENAKNTSQNITNNSVVFLSTTKELLEKIEKEKEKIIDISTKDER